MQINTKKVTLRLDKIKITKLENTQDVRGGSIPPTKKTDFWKCGPITKTFPVGTDTNM